MTNATLALAHCTCGHYCDDHRMVSIDTRTGKITMGECRATSCPCTTYAPVQAPCANADGQPAVRGLNGLCQACWNASVLARQAQLVAQTPGYGRPPNRRLEWRAR